MQHAKTQMSLHMHAVSTASLLEHIELGSEQISDEGLSAMSKSDLISQVVYWSLNLIGIKD